MPEDEIVWEEACCASCEGFGCSVCNRTGKVLVKSPKTPCRHCEGIGCFYCGFTGWTRPKTKYE